MLLTLLLGAALAHVPPPDFGGGPTSPGTFGLSRPEHVRGTLEDAGWTGVTTADHAGRTLIGGGGSLDTTMDHVERSGPGRAPLENADADQAAKALAAIRAALVDHLTDQGVALGGVALATTALAS